MIEIELDGQKVEVQEGSMVMHAADKAGTYIPHFCYHKKLSIAASCRMCLVDVEKAPKPMPACATPVTQGMIVRTRSDKALRAQRDVMEFLLINHPLDCPICDQGGECQLQDLAVGYGGSASRYEEEKRVVAPKNVGPLISMQEMSRCIHCTRCVRFGQEVAGDMELGMIHRGEHAEITTIKGETVDSELSGNMIDLCPVGALTSKPFRYAARTWELSRRKSVSPHDSVGANQIVQVKNGRVLRVVPLENEAVNECWLADRDRFAYEGLQTEDRLLAPKVKQDGQWVETTWPVALEYVARSLQSIRQDHGASSLGALVGSLATLEETHLLSRLMRALGSDNVDHRLRQLDFSNAAPAGQAHWLGRSLASLSTLDRALIIGSSLRKEHPLMAARLRRAVRHGAELSRLGASSEDWAMPVAHDLSLAPSQWLAALGAVAAAVAEAAGVASPVNVAITNEAKALARSLSTGADKAVLLGKGAEQHPDFAQLHAMAAFIAENTGAKLGFLGAAGNAVGHQWASALPVQGGLNAAQMLGSGTGASPLKAAVLLHTDPCLDAAGAASASAALQHCALVVALTPYATDALDCADVMLPISPYTETSGSFVNAEGRVQSFHGVVRPQGDSRPAWKVLRVLAESLGLEGFAFDSTDEVRQDLLGSQTDVGARLNNATTVALSPVSAASSHELELWPLVPAYGVDAVVRRSASLQATTDAQRASRLGVPSASWQAMGLAEGDRVRVSQGEIRFELLATQEPSLARNVLRLPVGLTTTAACARPFGPVHIEKV